jgi:MFS transporter, DHA3 family, macrolide efflux protein
MIKSNNSSTSTFLAVLQTGAFKHLWFAQICSQIAANSLIFILGLRIYQTTQSNTAVSILFIVYGIPAVLFGLIAGTIVDKIDNRKTLLICDIGRAFVALGFLFFPTQIILIYIFTFINAMISQFYVPAEAPTIPRLVPPNLLVTANSMFSFTYFSSLALGSITAGPLLRLFGSQGVFLFIIILFLIAALNVSRLPSSGIKKRSLEEILDNTPLYLIGRVIVNIKEALSYVRQIPELFDALLLLVGTQVMLALLATLGPGFADRVMGIDVRDSSLLITGPAVLGIISGALWVGHFSSKIKPFKLIKVGIISAGLLLIIIAITVRLSRFSWLSWLFIPMFTVPLEFSLFYLLGFANSFLDVPANSILQSQSDERIRGRVYGILAASVGGLGVLPVIVGGLLADAIGVGKVILLLGTVIFIYGIWRTRYNKKMNMI